MYKLYLFFIMSCLSSYLVYININQRQDTINKSDILIEDNYDSFEEYVNEETNKEEESVITEKLVVKENNNKKNYEKELMTIEIPKIDLKGKIYNKNSKLNNIDKNIIIMNESDYPNTLNGIVILGAHSGIGKYAYFKNLNELEIGDYIYLNYNNNKFSYKVVNYYLDYKDGYISINNVNNKKKLYLYTCNPNDKENYLIIVCESE